MQIRNAAPGDMEIVRALLDVCALPHDDLTLAHLDHFVVACVQEECVGTVGLEPRGEAALLRSLAVAPEHRGRGTGRRLIEAVEERARREGIRALYLLTTTAAGYFEAFGYERLPREALPPSIRDTPEAARLCPASATCMTKPLSVAALP